MTNFAPIPAHRAAAGQHTWLRRPRWLLSIVAAGATLIWLAWPVPIYWIGTLTFLMMEGPAGRQHLIGTVRVQTHPSPRRAREALDLLAQSATAKRVAPDGAFWLAHGGETKLCFLHSNLLVTVTGTREDFPPPAAGAITEWPGPEGDRLVAVRRQIDAEIRAQRVGGKYVGRERNPRGLVWLFPDGCNWTGVEARRAELRALFSP